MHLPLGFWVSPSAQLGGEADLGAGLGLLGALSSSAQAPFGAGTSFWAC